MICIISKPLFAHSRHRSNRFLNEMCAFFLQHYKHVHDITCLTQWWRVNLCQLKHFSNKNVRISHMTTSPWLNFFYEKKNNKQIHHDVTSWWIVKNFIQFYVDEASFLVRFFFLLVLKPTEKVLHIEIDTVSF